MQKFLIIDDEIDLCDLIAELADDAGLEVRTVSVSSEVEKTIDEFAPDAMMMDLMMPGTDGVELLRLLAGKLKNVKIALMSGSDSRVLNSARRLGSAHGLDIIATMEKPLEISLIRKTIEQLTSGTQVAAPVTAAALSQAITEQQLHITVQPIINLEGRTVGIEALPRWLQADGTELTAEDFIGKVQADGLLGQLTQEVAEKTFAGAKRIGFEGTISLNIMPEQLKDPYFAQRLSEMAAQHQIAPGRIAIEISELALQPVVASLLAPLQDVRSRGIQIWLDNYAGKLPLADLAQLPLTGMKLSRHMVLGLPNALAETMIGSAIGLAKARELPVYAVAVETEAQRDIVLKLGVTGYQGRLIAAPMSFDDFVTFKA